ncbi:MAG TPA: HD domain-containing phosphohydrolase [Acidimicrobiales bacterium]|nr:HD domain-containing phosphohydrolase [Acidimicrobiales bacterium]
MKHRSALLQGAVVLAAASALVGALRLDGGVDWPIVAAFVAFLIMAESTSVLMGVAMSVSPGFMIIMASIAVLAADGPSGAVAGAAVIGCSSGLALDDLRSRNLRAIVMNSGQILLAAAGGALAYVTVLSLGGWAFVAAVVAVAVYGSLNIGLLIGLRSLSTGPSAAVLWADMRPAVPNYLAFGLLGVLIGQIGAELGAVAVLLLAIPVVIGRWTFRSFERTRDAHDASIRLFIRLIEAKDPYTAGHTERVAKYSCYIAEEMGLSPDRIAHLRQSALMHDVGKLAVPSRLLNKPGRLTADEWEIVRRHNDAGIGILGRVNFMRDMAVVASDRAGRFEHDTAGMAAELVLEGHIVAVADAFDAMTSTRSYRQALDQDIAFEELRKNAGTQFNPTCTEALIAVIEQRGERYGRGFEVDAHAFAVAPPDVGVGSAGLGDLSDEATAAGSSS